jgi:hypothetical protein
MGAALPALTDSSTPKGGLAGMGAGWIFATKLTRAFSVTR